MFIGAKVFHPHHKFEDPTITIIFKSSNKESNDSNKTCRYARDISLYQNFVCRRAMVHALSA
jgi:hypothetical protein